MLFKTGKININKLLQCIKTLSTEKKIYEISKHFLGTPYKKNSLIGSAFKKEHLVIDFESVDCMTFIEYVEALRLSSDFDSFIENLKLVRYFDGVVSFEKRRHFFTDWEYLPTVKNATVEVCKPFVKNILKKINKKLWIEGIQIKERLVNYIPAESLKEIAFKLITGDYCGFYTSKEGLDVTHVGIMIIDENSIKLRHASSIKGKVIDENFLEYLKEKEGIIILRPQENVISA